MNTAQEEKKIIIFLFDRFTSLDVIGPYEVFSRLPGHKIIFAGKEEKGYKDPYGLELQTNRSIHEVKEADILLVPGGYGIDPLLTDSEVLQWIKEMDKSTRWTTSVCSGSILLAGAGLLDGRKCTTHWRRKEQLSSYNVIIENQRFVQDGKYITSAGVSAGIDMALFLVGRISGEQSAKMIQLSIEYDPKPPFDCGCPEKAPMEILEKLTKR
jgi:transcriptional regulator GlxA family with amidase domain